MTSDLHDALETLAHLADHEPAPDRLAGIARKRRAQRNRRATAGAGVAALAVIATSIGVATVPGGGDADGGIATVDPTPVDDGTDLDVTLRIVPAGADEYRLTYEVSGTSVPVRNPREQVAAADAGVLSTTVLLDGTEVGGSGEDDNECDPQGAPAPYENSFGPGTLKIGAGDHTVQVVARYCGLDGSVRTADATSTSYFLGEATVADRAGKDLDGDGTAEKLVLVDEGSDSSLRISGSVEGTVSLQAADPVWISGVEDLDGDGDREVLVDVRWRSVTALVLVTLDGDRPALVTSPAQGPRRYSGAVDDEFHGTMVIDGVLTTWHGPGAGDEVGPVEGGTWVLEGTRLRLVPFAQQMCGSVQVSPQRC